MKEDLSLKHSQSIIDMVNIEDVVTTIELDCSDVCSLDTLLRIDEHPEELSCKQCVYKDITIDDEVICPLKIIGEFLLLK